MFRRNPKPQALPQPEQMPSEDALAEPTLSREEFEKFRTESGFKEGFRGTFWTPDKSTFLYEKACQRVETSIQASEALALLRFATSKGVLYPETQWGAYKDPMGYQLFAVTPRLINYMENQAHLDPSRQPVRTFSPPYADLFTDGSQVLDMYRRLDPTFEPSVGPEADSILHVLNPFEASHADNWGWDTTGTAYPIDVEVLDVADSSDIIHQWYSQQLQQKPEQF